MEEKKISKAEIIEMIDEMAKSYERLPEHAMYAQVTQNDIYSVLLLMLAAFKAEG